MMLRVNNLFIKPEEVRSYWLPKTGFLRLVSTVLFLSLSVIIFKIVIIII